MLSILDLFTISRPEWSVEAIAGTLGLSQPTAYRYVASLCTSGLLAPFGTGCYVLGPRIIQLDRQIRRTDPLISLAADVAPELLEQVPQGVVALASVLGDTVITVFQAKKPAEIPISFERGTSMQLFGGAAAKAILAHLPRQRLTRLYLEQSKAIEKAGLGESWKEFLGALQELRRKHVVVTRGELEAASWGVAAPVFDPTRNVSSSISLILPAASFSVALIEKLREPVRAAASRITEAYAEMVGPSERAER